MSSGHFTDASLEAKYGAVATYIENEWGEPGIEIMHRLINHFEGQGRSLFEKQLIKKVDYHAERKGLEKVEQAPPVPPQDGEECESGLCDTYTVDFEDLERGTVVDQIMLAGGALTIDVFGDERGEGNDDNDAMVFDADNVTGADTDLAGGDGKILVISEDDDADDVDDSADGGIVSFRFSEVVNLTSIDIVDTEEGGTFEAFDMNGVSLGTLDISETVNGEVQTFDLSQFDNVASFTVDFVGSGALDNLKLEFCKKEICKEYTVDFEEFAQGDTVSEIVLGGGLLTIEIFGDERGEGNDDNDAMVFDADNVTGGDFDLAGGDGKILVISEDDDADDVDDSADGGLITFRFSDVVNLTSIDIIDTEEGGTFEAFDINGVSLGTLDISETVNGEVKTFDLSQFDAVAHFTVDFVGSGALDNLQLEYCFDEICQDYVVDFEEFSKGDTVSEIVLGEGALTINVFGDERGEGNDDNDTMVFDADNVTGGDTDLANGDGKLLVITEHDDADDVDDSVDGGVLTFEFSDDVDLTSIDIVDTEEGGTFEAFDRDGNSLGTLDISETVDGEVKTFDLSQFDDVAHFTVDFVGSGGVDNLMLEYCRSITDADVCGWH